MILVFIILLPIILVIGFQLFWLGDGILYRKYDSVKELESYFKEMELKKSTEIK